MKARYLFPTAVPSTLKINPSGTADQNHRFDIFGQTRAPDLRGSFMHSIFQPDVLIDWDEAEKHDADTGGFGLA